MRIILFLFLALGFAFSDPGTEPDDVEARKAFNYLNSIRKDPAAFSKEMPFLKQLKAIHQLKWNDTLALVAKAKAIDMSERNYFAHVNPDGFGINYLLEQAGYKIPAKLIPSKTANSFESCNGGASSGKEAVKMLLVDKDVPSLMHRNHLLGLDGWTSSLVDIGIGFVRAKKGSYYSTYTCIIIAKH